MHKFEGAVLYLSHSDNASSYLFVRTSEVSNYLLHSNGHIEP